MFFDLNKGERIIVGATDRLDFCLLLFLLCFFSLCVLVGFFLGVGGLMQECEEEEK